MMWEVFWSLFPWVMALSLCLVVIGVGLILAMHLMIEAWLIHRKLTRKDS